MKRVDSKASATPRVGGVTGKGFKPGQSGNPGGRAKVDPHLKEWLASRGLEWFEKAEALYEKAVKKGDLKTAATVLTTLLRKVAPDADVILVHRTEKDSPLEVQVGGEVKHDVAVKAEVKHDVPDDGRLARILAVVSRSGAALAIVRPGGAQPTPDAPADAVPPMDTD